MDIKPIELTILQLLNSNFYLIPAFQRAYSWGSSHVEDFWNDVFEAQTGDYFIGAFVVYPTGGQYKPLAVVDGQQRLTTMTIALAAIRTVMRKLGADDIAKGVQARIARDNISNKTEYVLQTETSYPYLQEYIQKYGPPQLKVVPGEEELALESAYKYLTAQVEAVVNGSSGAMTNEEAVAKLEGLRDRLLGIKLILIQLPNEEDACTIFETLNTRGKNLRVADLVKNHLFRLIGNQNVGVDLAKSKWTAVVKEVGANDMDRFVHHAWLSKNEYVGRPQLYRAIRRKVTTTEGAHTFVDRLKDEAIDYRYITLAEAPADSKLAPVAPYLQALRMFRVEQPHPFLLALLRQLRENGLTLKQVTTVLAALENFHFQFTALTAQRTGGGTARMYVASAHDLMMASDKNARQTVLRRFLDKLRERTPKKSEFVAAFVALSYDSRSKNVLRYALERIDTHLRKATKLPVDYRQMTIEHLAPQKPTSGQAIGNVHQIGNLVLLSKPQNDEFANRDFKSKQKLLESYQVPVDQELLKASSWETADVEARSHRLADLSYEKIFVF